MNSIILLLCCLGALVSSAPGIELIKPKYDIEKAEVHFEEFIKKYGKVYADETEKKMRFKIFKRGLERVIEYNKNSKIASFDINESNDLTDEEFRRRYAGYVPGRMPHCTKVSYNASGLSAPESFDWRTQNKVTQVKQQGNCGSCWAFSAIGAIEGQYAIVHNELKEFSEQQLLDCDPTGTCTNGFPAAAVDAVAKQGGVNSEAKYPYKGVKGTCQFDANAIEAKVTGCKRVTPSSEDELMALLANNGPLSFAVDAENNEFNQYTGGILQTCSFKKLSHAVLLVGYGTENEVPYWIVKNSWGTGKGEAGYWRLKRNINACGMMTSDIFTATVE